MKGKAQRQGTGEIQRAVSQSELIETLGTGVNMRWRYLIHWFDKKYNRWRESICIPAFNGDEEKALKVAMRNFEMEIEDGREAMLIDNYTGKVIHSNCDSLFRNHSVMST